MKPFAVTFLLSRHIHGAVEQSISLHVTNANSEDEAVGESLREALKERPGFSVQMTLAIEIVRQTIPLTASAGTETKEEAAG